MDSPPQPRAPGAKRRRWIPETILVLISAGLGFGIAEFADHRDEVELRAIILNGLAAEVRHNRDVLEPLSPLHRAWADELADARASDGESALDVWFATRPELPEGTRSPFPFLRRSAWDAAQAGGTLRLVDYEMAAALAEIYRAQEIAVANVDRLANGALSSTATYDPEHAEAAVRLLWLTLVDIASAEAILLDLYREHASLLQAAARDDD